MYVDVIKSLCTLPATDLNFTAELKRATQRQIGRVGEYPKTEVERRTGKASTT